MTIRETAAMMARTSAEVWPALDLISVLETPGARARYRASLERLRTVFAFDVDVYYQLADEPADRHPRICRSCGCSDWDARDEGGEPCAWSTDASCTRCIGAALERAQ
ncbi:hypothetical protein [Sphingomonas sp. GC_Shp_2]|uniref:hypothetical protein n=1 Tax=Sphingomonas sp. GC_Shp_2 TaxID=2937384 RepID=UPI00226AA25D|nr:hypothetical protein [Sphingomonas sp. GC_Shp_2]